MVGTEGEDVTPRRAASVVVVRDGDNGVEVLLLRRTSKAAFAPDRFVFPGGSVDASDQRLPIIGPPQVDERGRAMAPAEVLDQDAGVVDDVFVAMDNDGVRVTKKSLNALLAAPGHRDHVSLVQRLFAQHGARPDVALFVDHVLVHRLDAGDHDEARRAAHVFAQLWPDGAPGVDVAAAFADYGAALY